MRVPYSWLREWVDVPWDARETGSRLTMSGFELEAIETAAPAFTGVVVAEILEATRHPQADKLQVCRVSFGKGDPVQIVCGAANARAGLKSALATVGAMLPGGMEIKAAKLRGVESFGMLASAKELGLVELSDGILELPQAAPVGWDLRAYLELDDPILELNVTPNRGDAMSILGIAREVAALAGKPLSGVKFETVRPLHTDIFPVHLEAPAACPKFAGRIIRGVDNRAATPLWMRERLRRAGVRSISPIVDVTNYVLIELGQPMHAYDLAKLRGEIRVRLANESEKFTTLDGKEVTASPGTLLISDRDGPVGLAGIMGGERTAVGEDTRDVFLEVAYFAPAAIQGRGRKVGLVTDASQRFERGVDPAQQERAIQRATALIVQIAGGKPGPVNVPQVAEHLPKRVPVRMRKSQLKRLLGIDVEPARVQAALTALDMKVSQTADGWEVMPPSHRFDITIEPDLIEEIARIVGFNTIPEQDAQIPQRFREQPEEKPSERSILEALAARGYYEAITFAFVDPELQKKLFPDTEGLALANAISSDLSVMRVSLWPGLVKAAQTNQRRQQDRIRLFEHGTRFAPSGRAVSEIDTLAGLAWGPRRPEQWGVPKAMRGAADFFDVKADLEALFLATGAAEEFTFEPGQLASLHPGRAAKVLRKGTEVGWIGELHPTLVRDLDFTYAPVLFELDFDTAFRVVKPAYEEISRYPQVRRDLALEVDEGVPLSALRERVRLSASSLLRGFRIFDLYRGAPVEAGRKSVALGLIFQDISRTLTDEDVDRAVTSIVADLRLNLDAKIRE